MSSELIINATPEETRVILLENKVMGELYVEREKDKGIVGNVYKGKVVRVLPGMQAAFVDIGLEKAAFLYAADILPDAYIFETNHEEKRTRGREEYGRIPPIQDMIKDGQEILVQVAKAPLGTKGARITTLLTISGRNLVLMPNITKVGISRRIENEHERQRLKKIVMEAKPSDVGFVVRTVCERKSKSKITGDMEYLLKQWEEIKKKRDELKCPSLIHSDLSLTLRTIRDLVTEDIERLVVDSSDEHGRILDFLNSFAPRLKSCLELYKGKVPIFEYYGLEDEIKKILSRKVWLKSGGYIIIDESEALVAIDVNTGRYVGRKHLDETILKTNLEAAIEIARQLRLRNCGGIIIVDFIDMERLEDREMVYRTFEQELRKDRAKTNILKISELGLLEMTRKRTRESLRSTLCAPCPYCDGKAFVKSKPTIAYELFRTISKELCNEEIKGIVAYVHPDLADTLSIAEHDGIENLRRKFEKTITIKAEPNFHIEQFDVFALK